MTHEVDRETEEQRALLCPHGVRWTVTYCPLCEHECMLVGELKTTLHVGPTNCRDCAGYGCARCAYSGFARGLIRHYRCSCGFADAEENEPQPTITSCPDCDATIQT